MRGLGWVVLLIGIIWGQAAANMKVSVSTESVSGYGIYLPSREVNNLGLMEDRRNHLMGAGLAVLVGVILIGFGSRSPNEVSTKAQAKATRTCPFCAEEVQAAAVLCRFCGKDLPAMVETTLDTPPKTAVLKDGYGCCPSCNAQVPNESVKCWSCDTRIREI